MDPTQVQCCITPHPRAKREKEKEQHRFELTKVPPLILDLKGPDAYWILAPIVDGHEGPRVETVA